MGHLREFARSGHPPTLLSAFLYFDVSFMVWVLLGPLGPFVADDLGLGPAQKGLLAAVPLLGGSIFRLVLGPLADRFGGRPVALAGMGLTLLPLLMGWLWADGMSRLLMVGLLLGVAGASFAVALPMAGRWYPPEHQGLAMGIAGAGNSGTLLATLFAPRLAELVGWKGVFGLAALPVALVAVFFYFTARDNPAAVQSGPPPSPLATLRKPDAGWFCLLYSLSFGGFVGLASFLTVFFRDEYSLTRVQSGDLATLCVMAGSFIRPVGGYLADRLGGVRMLQYLLAGIALIALGAAQRPAVVMALVLVVVLMACLGMANGAIFQLVPQRFPRDVGAITGLVGAAGGIGGFCLPWAMGSVREAIGTYAPGFIGFGLLAAVCWTVVFVRGRAAGWHQRVSLSPVMLAPAAAD